jgi:O-antigen/teichoic acid export membrane protein
LAETLLSEASQASAPTEPAALVLRRADAPRTDRRVGRSLRAAIVFGFGSALQRGVAFLLLPVYTRALAPAQYGTLSVLLAVSSAAGILFAFGLDMGLFRSFFLYADEPERQRRFIGSVWRFLIAVPIVLSLLVAAIAAPFVGGIRNVTPLDVLLALLAGAFFAGASAVPLVIMRVQQRLRDFIALSLVDAVATPVLTLIMVVWLHDGIGGWLIAAAASNAILLLAALFVVPWNRGVVFDTPMVASALRFGATLIPHAFALWALLLLDRIVLAGLVSARQLGIYSLAATLGVPVAIGVQSLNQAMMPSYALAGVKPEHRDHLADLIVVQVTVVLAICLAGALLGGPLLILMAAHSYDRAAPLVAWIVLGYCFLGFYLVPMNGITLGAGRSSFVWVVSALGAVSNVVLLVVFVPNGGIRAGAVADAAAYFVLLACITVYARRPENPVRYRWSQLLPVLAVAVGVYIGGRLTTPSSGALSLTLRLAWIAGFALFCAAGYRIRRRGITRLPATAERGGEVRAS